MGKEGVVLDFTRVKSKAVVTGKGDLFHCRSDRAALAYIYYTRIEIDESVAVQLMNAVRNQEPDCVILLSKELSDKVQAMDYTRLMTTLFEKESEIT